MVRAGEAAAARPHGSTRGRLIIRGQDVRWQPAIDINRVILGGQVVAVVALLTIRTMV